MWDLDLEQKTEDDHKDKMKQKIIPILIVLTGFFAVVLSIYKQLSVRKECRFDSRKVIKEKAAGMDQAINKKSNG